MLHKEQITQNIFSIKMNRWVTGLYLDKVKPATTEPICERIWWLLAGLCRRTKKYLKSLQTKIIQLLLIGQLLAA